jgi:membrane-associated phospholipid phosphatase
MQSILHTVFLVFFLLTSVGLAGQDFPYTLDAKREVGLFAAGLGSSLLGRQLERGVTPFTDAELRAQRRRHVWAIDRRATYNESREAFATSNHLLRAAVLLPAAVMTSRRGRRRGVVVATMLAQTLLLNDGLTRLTKAGIRRARPLTFNDEYDEGAKLKLDARLSFVSGHTSNTAALSFFTAKVLHDLYPDSPLRTYFWAGAAVVPLATGYARYRAGKHFPTDIAAGYALGAALGILIPQWHKSDKEAGWRVGMTANGVGLALRW